MTARLLLCAWLLLTSVAAGAVAWRAIHGLTGGAWGVATDAAFRRLAGLVVVAALGAIVALLAAAQVSPWIHAPVEPTRRWYFHHGFLVARTAACFIAWGAGAWLAKRLPALVLVAWLLACGVFANDWIASLSPDWRSSQLGFTLACGQLALALAMATAVAARDATPSIRADLGALLLAASLGWAYLAGVDYLTAWIADQRSETAWYLPRVHGPFGLLGAAAGVLHLVVPFGLLVSPRIRVRIGVLRAAAVSIAFGEACHVAWMVVP